MTNADASRLLDDPHHVSPRLATAKRRAATSSEQSERLYRERLAHYRRMYGLRGEILARANADADARASYATTAEGQAERAAIREGFAAMRRVWA